MLASLGKDRRSGISPGHGPGRRRSRCRVSKESPDRRPCSGVGYTGRRVLGGECGEAVLALEGIMSFPSFR